MLSYLLACSRLSGSWPSSTLDLYFYAFTFVYGSYHCTTLSSRSRRWQNMRSKTFVELHLKKLCQHVVVVQSSIQSEVIMNAFYTVHRLQQMLRTCHIIKTWKTTFPSFVFSIFGRNMMCKISQKADQRLQKWMRWRNRSKRSKTVALPHPKQFTYFLKKHKAWLNLLFQFMRKLDY